MDKYGYARVSAVDQYEARQLLEMEQFGIKPENIFIDKHPEKTLTDLSI